MTGLTASKEGWSCGIVGLLGVAGYAFVAAACSLPPQVRLFSIYLGTVAVLLFFGCAAVLRTTLPRLAPLPPHIKRRVSMAQGLVGALVWAHPVALLGYAGLAAVLVGHWPSFNHPDPKQLQLPVLHGFVILCFYGSAFGIAAWAFLFPFAVRALGSRGISGHVLTFVLGLVACYLITVRNLGGVSEWYAD